MLKRLRKLSSRPIAITETATSSDGEHSGVDVRYKNAWITRLFEYALRKDVRMVVWFNQDKGGDWSIFGGTRGDTQVGDYRAYSGYRSAVGQSEIVGSDVADPPPDRRRLFPRLRQTVALAVPHTANGSRTRRDPAPGRTFSYTSISSGLPT